MKFHKYYAKTFNYWVSIYAMTENPFFPFAWKRQALFMKQGQIRKFERTEKHIYKWEFLHTWISLRNLTNHFPCPFNINNNQGSNVRDIFLYYVFSNVETYLHINVLLLEEKWYIKFVKKINVCNDSQKKIFSLNKILFVFRSNSRRELFRSGINFPLVRQTNMQEKIAK